LNEVNLNEPSFNPLATLIELSLISE